MNETDCVEDTQPNIGRQTFQIVINVDHANAEFNEVPEITPWLGQALKEGNIACQSQQKKDLNQIIWLWSYGKKLTKQEIKDYAIKIYQDAGVKTFKASDGWYRRWLNNWKNDQNVKNLDKTDDLLYSKRLIHEEQKLRNICDLNEETNKVNENCHTNVTLFNRENDKDCLKYNLSDKSDDNTQNNQQELSTLPEEQYIQDCNQIERLPKIINEKYISFNNKNGEKYFPHFKAKVISYALKHSLKNAATTFKVNKETVSGWVRQSKQDSSKPQKNKLFDCMFQDDVGPDDIFIQWLKTSDKKTIISREVLLEKVSELIKPVENQEPNKKNLWFFLYARRLQDNNKNIDKILIKYPLAFKQEVVSYTNNFSKKMISKIFSIDRKRICEWDSDFKNDNVKKRDVSKYLTDPDVDSKVWEWYSLMKEKPTSKEVRRKAALLYEEAGFPGMMCSHGWYYRWRMRHHLPPARISQASRDSELLSWVLKQIDQNRSILHSDLLNHASSFKGSDFQASSSWVFRFTKRYMSHLQPGSLNIALPDRLSEDMDNFKSHISNMIADNNLLSTNIIAFDELPLNFTYTDSLKNENIVGKSGWENCQASVILSCRASGSLIPTCLIFKNSFEENDPDFEEIQPVLIQPEGINDKSTIEKWFNNLLRFVSIPSVVVCDAYDPHFYLKNMTSEHFTDKSIELLTIPAGCSSHLQPILFGIAEQFKTEIENCYQRWCHESSMPGSVKYKLPSNNDIYRWVQKAHCSIATDGEDLIRNAFVKAGYIGNSVSELTESFSTNICDLSV